MSVDFVVVIFFFYKQKTAYEVRISDWSSDVCSSDLSDTMMPIVFCASLAPCESENSAELTICIKRNTGSIAIGRALRNNQVVPTISPHSSEERRVGKESVSTCRSRW